MNNNMTNQENDLISNSSQPETLENVEAEETVDTEALLRKYDAESNLRVSKGIHYWIVMILTISMSLFHFYMAGIGRMPSNKMRAIHLAYTMALIFLLYPWKKKADNSASKTSILDYLLAIIGAGSSLYMYFNIDAISMRSGLGFLPQDRIAGIVCIIMVLEATRRCIGWELPTLASIFILYAALGKYLPGALMHRGYSVNRLAEHMYISAEGIFGIPLGVSATIIFLFILFGAFLTQTGLSEFFTNTSMAMAGSRAGGPAKVAIIASGFLGMINGSAAANVVTTGAFTIPLMKKLGYKPYFAGAVEAVASTGGQMMPPVMGAAAFIMAEFLGVGYRTIMLAAFIPSVLYYVALWASVDIEARRLKLQGVPKEMLPNAMVEFKKSGHLVIPILLLIGMLMFNYSPSYAAFYSIVTLIIVSTFRKSSRLDIKKLILALDGGAKQAIPVAIACAVVGLVIGVVTLTGLGLQLANMIIFMSGGLLVPTMILTMIACIILGMGMPTSAAYIVAATVASPALTQLGVEPLTAHMFVFYYAVLSAITPPVALAAYAGAGIAGASPSKVGWTAVRLGLVGFIIPFMFVFSPNLLMQRSPWLVPWVFFTAVIGCYCLGAAVQGYFKTKSKIYETIGFFATALLLIDSKPLTDAIGLSMFVILFLVQTRRAKKLAAS
jgi:TRAP transporter 4TM/12TM fusion protein